MGVRVEHILILCTIHLITNGDKLISKLHKISYESHHNFTNNNNTYSEEKLNNTDVCKNKTCIYKCCPDNTHVLYRGGVKTCVKYPKPFTFDFLGVNLYNKERSKVLTSIGNSTYIHMVTGKFANETFKNVSSNGGGFRHYETYLTEDSAFYLESHNTYERWVRIEKDKFCVDYQLSNKNRTPAVRVWVEWHVTTREKNVLVPMTLMVSCVFLFIVLVVYALLPELRNLCGMILIAYVGSLFWAFLLLIIIQSSRYTIEVCVYLTLFIYFFFMSSFCWMNVMSYDIWWTFRGYAKARPIHRRGESFKFAMYCLYAWGLPLAMTIFTGIMDIDKMFADKPWVIQPNIGRKGCFMDGGEKLLYLYTPMLILIFCNWFFYLMTAYNVWRLTRGTAVLDSAAAGNPAAHRTHRHRFMLYVKLSIVMGLNWVLEVVSFVYPGFRVWSFSDAYNMLMGLFIFLIFVCKMQIYRKLKKRFVRYSTKWSPTKSYTSSNSDSMSSTQEASLPVICSNPKGPTSQIS